MRWTVEGADKETGQDRVITIEADNKAQAERIASQRGIFASSVRKPDNLSPAEEIDHMIVRGDLVTDGAVSQTCDNCGRTVGKLESLRDYNGHAVCADCWGRVTASNAASQPLSVAAIAGRPAPCPNCGSLKPAIKKSKGSAVVMILLLLLWVLPGVLYAIVYNGYIYACPDCGYKRGDAT